MTGPFQIRDQGRQLGPSQAAFLNFQRHGGFERALAMLAPIVRAGMLCNSQWRLHDVDLLHDAGQVAIATQTPAAARAGVEYMFSKVRHLLGRKWLTFMLGMAQLAADRTAFAAVHARSGRRFDEIRRG